MQLEDQLDAFIRMTFDHPTLQMITIFTSWALEPMESMQQLNERVHFCGEESLVDRTETEETDGSGGQQWTVTLTGSRKYRITRYRFGHGLSVDHHLEWFSCFCPRVW